MITKFKLFENNFIDDVSTWKEGDFVCCINNEKQEWLTIGKPYRIDKIEFGGINKIMGIQTGKGVNGQQDLNLQRERTCRRSRNREMVRDNSDHISMCLLSVTHRKTMNE